jgi:hypothetical protein
MADRGGAGCREAGPGTAAGGGTACGLVSRAPAEIVYCAAVMRHAASAAPSTGCSLGLGLLLLLGCCGAVAPLDLSSASIIIDEPASPRARVYAQMLSDEVFKRVFVRWPIATNGAERPAHSVPIHLATASPLEVDRSARAPEGYELTVGADGVVVRGTDQRGLLYGVGRLIRTMNLTMTENYFHARVTTLEVASPLSVASAPDRPMRGIQFGYRPKTNSYDGLTPELFEQYIVDLSMFGLNQAELIPHSFDDSPYSPHFGLSHTQMNIAMSAICDKYGINVSLWYPACNPAEIGHGCPKGNYRNKTVMDAATADYHTTLSGLPRVDTVFINAGDPGGQSPDDLVMITQAARKILTQYHPHADTWICPQDWVEKDFARWNELIAMPGTKDWLAGTIYGPGMLVDVPTYVKLTPPGFPLRMYPDITHSVSDQLEVPDWDPAYQFTLNREPVNPRPTQEAAIAWRQKVHADAGVSAYNEGCHDDVNKHVWLSVFWGCDLNASDPAAAALFPCSSKAQGETEAGRRALLDSMLRDYSRVHFGWLLEPLVQPGILNLEQNWVGAIAKAPVPDTFARFEQVERTMTPRNRWSWRLQQLMYRAHYDMFVFTRVQNEKAGETAALGHLCNSSTKGPYGSRIAAAEAAIARAMAESKAQTEENWVEMRVWAEAVFQSVHQQFSVPIYGGEYTRRGSNLDLARLPLAASNMPYISERLQLVTAAGAASAAAIVAELCSHTAAADGFYDDLGELSNQPHLVLKPDPTAQGDCRGLANYTVVTTSPSSQYYDVPDDNDDDQRQLLLKGQKSHKLSQAPPALPANTTRQLLTQVAVKHGIPVRMRYPIATPGRYECVVVGEGVDVELRVNGGAPIQAGTLTKGEKTTVKLPGTLSGLTEIQWSVAPEGSLSLAEVWLNPSK